MVKERYTVYKLKKEESILVSRVMALKVGKMGKKKRQRKGYKKPN